MQAGEVRGSVNAIAIELTGPSNVVIRDRRGFISVGCRSFGPRDDRG
jgi:hypothetical protein